MEQEPKTLFWHGHESVFEEAVLHGIYESDLTTVSYDYQAVGLEKIPSFSDGDATIRVVPVAEGDKVVDVNGDVIELQIGDQVINAAGDATTYDGSTLLMDQLIVDFRMKQRFWSDGRPVTAADSVYSFHLAARPETPGDKYVVDRTASYQASANLQIRWSGLPGFIDSNFQSNFHHPLPRHTWLDLALTDLTTATVSSRFPLGDGPFQIVEWKDGQSIRLTPNPHYYRSLDGYPQLDGVVYRFISDPNERIAQLLAGSCHVITHESLDAALLPFILEAETEHLLNAHIVPDRFGWELVFGINSWGEYSDGLGRPDWFEDARVRQAVAMCIDKQELVDTLYLGQTDLLDGYVPSSHPLKANGLTQWQFDVTAANRLLDEVEFLDNNGDGVREDPTTGTDFRIAIVIGLGQQEHLLAQMIETFLRDCGIELYIEQTANQNLTSSNEVDKVHGRRFDLALSLSEATLIPDCDRFMSTQISGSPTEINERTGKPFIGWQGRNRSGWSSAAFDEYCSSALTSPVNSPEQKSNHQEAQRIFAKELPVLPLLLEPKITLVHPEVRHIVNDPTQDSELWNLYAVEFTP
ncbi:MAG: ABC transporter substrate-binding protein, partial [Candidatus Promineifilaceae bacterium]|nr:ABC transporter substrate-binding protein [Candidatus Promineifilaceae bacterium]